MDNSVYFDESNFSLTKKKFNLVICQWLGIRMKFCDEQKKSSEKIGFDRLKHIKGLHRNRNSISTEHSEPRVRM